MMNAIRPIASGLLLATLASQAWAQQSSTTVPPPSEGSIAEHVGWPVAKNASDVDSVDHLVAALYNVISGPAGQPRDWDRFRSLFLPDGRLGAIRPDTAERKSDAVFLSPDMYVERDDPY